MQRERLEGGRASLARRVGHLHQHRAGRPEREGGRLGREILYTTTSWKQMLILRLCQNCDKSLYTPPPLGGGGGGGGI